MELESPASSSWSGFQSPLRRGRDQGQGLPPSTPAPGLGARKSRGSPRPRTAKPTPEERRVGRPPGQPSPRRPQACRPQRPCASHVPTRRTPAARPTYCLKPSTTSRPRPTFERNIRAPTGRSHTGVGSSPAARSVGHLWNARTTFPRMPRGSAGLASRAGPYGQCSSFALRVRSLAVERLRWSPQCSWARESTGPLGQPATHLITF